MSLLPLRAEPASRPADPRVLDVAGEDADRAFEVLSSETARRILAAVYETPRTPPEVREVVGTSLQNVHYHIDRLESAGLVEGSGVAYSEKGNEMTVYGPANEAVVLFAGTEDDRSRLRDLVARLLGLAAVAAVATLGFAALLPYVTPHAGDGGSADTLSRGGAGAEAVAVESSGAGGLDPVLAFALGAVAVALVVAAWWVTTSRR